MSSEMRPVTENESSAILQIASRLPENRRARLIADLQQAMAKDMNPDGSIVRFELAGYERVPNSGQHSFGVEGKMVDGDGADLDLILYADQDDRLYELELIKWNSDSLVGPVWKTLRLFD